MAQSVCPRERPAGSEGDAEQEVTEPPPSVGVCAEIGVPEVAIMLAGLYAIVGATSLIVMSRVELAVPPVFEAVTVKALCEASVVAVPETAQVLVLRLRPVGSAGLTVHPVIAPPVELGVWVARAELTVPTTEAGLKAMTGAWSLTVRVNVAVAEPPVLVAVIVCTL